MRRQVNLRFVALILVSLVILGIGTHFLHGYQLKRNAGVLLRRAEDAQAEKDYGKALGYYGRYLQFRPDDTAALANYALLLEQESKTPAAQLRAYLILEETLRRLPERDDVRRCVVRLAMEPALSRFAETEKELTILLKSSPNDAELEELYGRCEEGCGHFTEAADWYDKAIEHDEHRVTAYVRLAGLYRARFDPPRYADADGVMERLVKANPESVKARLARGTYYCRLSQLAEPGPERRGLLEEAAREIGYARERLAPDGADVLLSSADLALDNGNRDEARRYLEEGFRQHGDDVHFPLGLASLALRSGDREAAVARLREAVKVLPERPDLIWTTADLFLDAGEPKEAEQFLDRLSQSDVHPAAVDYLRARIDYGNGDFAKARTLLEKQRPELAKWPDLARQADALLGQCYQRLDNPEEQLAAYRRAATGSSPTVAARLGLGSALLANNQLEEAIAEYRKLMTPDLPELRLTVARLLILRNLRLAPARRDWAEPEHLLREAPEEVRKTVDYTILNAELLVARGEVKPAAAALEAACQQTPREIRYWTARAAVADRAAPAGGPERFADSFRVLDEAEKALGDRVELRLERASRLAASSAPSAREALRKLEEPPEGTTPAERTALWSGLATAYKRLGDTDSARKMLRQVAEESPSDLRSREGLFDLALAAGDDDGAKQQEDGIRKIEGDGGPLGRCAEAMRLVARARKGDRDGLAEARRLLAEVAKVRPNWSRAALVTAEISDLEGDVEPAIDGYRRAIDLGERSPATVHRVVRLLIGRRRTEEARQVLARLQERAAVPDLGRDAAELSLLNQEPKERTRDLAQAVARDSKDYRDLLFLGQVLWSLDDREDRQKAEDAFRQAVKLGPKAPEAWFALVAFLAGTDRKKQAEEETLRAKEALPAQEAAPALAACYEVIGQRDKAEELYLAALKSRPNDAGLLRGAAAFYLRGGDAEKADSHLLHLITGKDASTDATAKRWARRTLALSLASSGVFSKSREGLVLLEENLRERPGDPDDQRVRALVLALQPGGRRESIRSLETSFAHMRPAPGEQFLLARLYEADRNWPRAKELLLGLLGGQGGDNPSFLAYYVVASLRHDGVKEAEKWLPRLEKAPDSAPVLEARARLMAARDQGGEAARLLTQFAYKEQAAAKDPAILGATAGVLEELGQFDEAEKLYREYAAAVGAKRPENALVLAPFLAKRNRLPEALDLCERAWTQCSPEVVARVSAGILRLGQPRPEDFRRVDHWLEEQLRKKPGSTGLLLARADLRDAEGRTEEAEAAYRLLARDPQNPNPMALNNLAWLLALNEGKYNEALKLVNRAVEVAGPVASRLDTRGMVHLLLGQTNQAVADLENAAAENPTDTVYFHLTRAYLQGHNRAAAERAWEKAKELHLTEKSLHRLERPEYQRVAAELEGK
jgi:tetratricopeptide (TPR) repeat protein